MKNLPYGKAIYLWQLIKCNGGDMSRVADVAQAMDFDSVFVKTTDGDHAFKGPLAGTQQELLHELAPLLKDRGIDLYLWGYVYGKDPVKEAEIIYKSIAEYYPKGFIVNAEHEFMESGMDAKAEILMSSLTELMDKDGLQDVSLILSSFRFPTSQPTFPWDTFAKYIQAWAPQVYWLGWKSPHTPGAQVKKSIQLLRAIKDIPVLPTGLASLDPRYPGSPTAWELNSFVQGARYENAEGISFWSWEHAEKLRVTWAKIKDIVFVEADQPPQGPPPAVDPPVEPPPDPVDIPIPDPTPPPVVDPPAVDPDWDTMKVLMATVSDDLKKEIQINRTAIIDIAKTYGLPGYLVGDLDPISDPDLIPDPGAGGTVIIPIEFPGGYNNQSYELIKGVPGVSQKGLGATKWDPDCGPASVLAILLALAADRGDSVNDLYDQTLRRGLYTNFTDLNLLFGRHGIPSSTKWALSLQELTGLVDKDIPFIALVDYEFVVNYNPGASFYGQHFFVVVGYTWDLTDTLDHRILDIIVMDPLRNTGDEFIAFPLADFMDAWKKASPQMSGIKVERSIFPTVNPAIGKPITQINTYALRLRDGPGIEFPSTGGYVRKGENYPVLQEHKATNGDIWLRIGDSAWISHKLGDTVYTIY